MTDTAPLDMVLRFTIHGYPAPQGSKRHIVNKSGKLSVIESSRKVKPWRSSVRDAALNAKPDPRPLLFARLVPVSITVSFMYQRPRSHYGTGRNASRLKPDAPVWMINRPDIDKVERSLLDGLTDAGVFADDCQVVHLNVGQIYSNDGFEGAEIEVRGLTLR